MDGWMDGRLTLVFTKQLQNTIHNGCQRVNIDRHIKTSHRTIYSKHTYAHSIPQTHTNTRNIQYYSAFAARLSTMRYTDTQTDPKRKNIGRPINRRSVTRMRRSQIQMTAKKRERETVGKRMSFYCSSSCSWWLPFKIFDVFRGSTPYMENRNVYIACWSSERRFAFIRA